MRIADPSAEARERALARVAKRAPDADVAAVADVETAVADADLVIEAAPEVLELKRALFGRVDAAAPAHAVLATNTSQLSVTALAAATRRAAQVCGMHWFNPPERMRLVESVRGLATSDATMALVRAVAESCGKTVVEVADRQGFVTTRVLAATLSGLWGVYSGFELCEAAALPGKEEYLDSEKYEIRPRDFAAPGNIVAEITMLNRLRRSHPAIKTADALGRWPCCDPACACAAQTSVPCA